MPILLVAVHFGEMSQFQFSFILKDMLKLNTGISPAFVFKVALRRYNDIHTLKKDRFLMLLVVVFLCVWYNHLITFIHWATFEVHSTSSTRDTDSVLRQAFVQLCRTTE